jgi:hypothetical protein
MADRYIYTGTEISTSFEVARIEVIETKAAIEEEPHWIGRVDGELDVGESCDALFALYSSACIPQQSTKS